MLFSVRPFSEVALIASDRLSKTLSVFQAIFHLPVKLLVSSFYLDDGIPVGTQGALVAAGRKRQIRREHQKLIRNVREARDMKSGLPGQLPEPRAGGH